MARQITAVIEFANNQLAHSDETRRLVLRQGLHAHHAFELTVPFDKVESREAGFLAKAPEQLLGKPSTRIGDSYVCPMLDGPKPHVGGLVLPPGAPTVFIGGLPAATMGDTCLCVSPVPNSIVLGSLGVFVGGRPAARMFDKTLHGDTLTTGLPTVLIGDIEAVAGPAIFPGVQRHRNCGVQAMQQVIRQATGVVHGEDELLHLAVAEGFVEAKPAGYIGSTKPLARHDMLAVHGVASNTVSPLRKLSPEDEATGKSPNAHGLLTATSEEFGIRLGPIKRGHLPKNAWAAAARRYFPLVLCVVEQRWLLTAYPVTAEEQDTARQLQECVAAYYDAVLWPFYRHYGHHFLAWMERAAK